MKVYSKYIIKNDHMEDINENKNDSFKIDSCSKDLEILNDFLLDILLFQGNISKTI